ncbi:hypothetical protein Nepgr_030334 [Nepenthes gracilis]|uniref:Uncharacterized protein n=1 Tax=Nepenthes gracilis TaxID=150966 RepID=A0AAD3TGH8_NEPGR|nr:hypothetical protein Nepgr_030334 [Nepenthes gracilis]
MFCCQSWATWLSPSIFNSSEETLTREYVQSGYIETVEGHVVLDRRLAQGTVSVRESDEKISHHFWFFAVIIGDYVGDLSFRSQASYSITVKITNLE